MDKLQAEPQEEAYLFHFMATVSFLNLFNKVHDECRGKICRKKLTHTGQTFWEHAYAITSFIETGSHLFSHVKSTIQPHITTPDTLFCMYKLASQPCITVPEETLFPFSKRLSLPQKLCYFYLNFLTIGLTLFEVYFYPI